MAESSWEQAGPAPGEPAHATAGATGTGVPLADRRWLLPGALGVFVVGVIAGCVMGGQALVPTSSAGPAAAVSSPASTDSGAAADSGVASPPPPPPPSVEPTPSAPPSQQVPATGVLHNTGNAQCVQAENKAGSPARLTGCSDSGAQRWQLAPVADGTYLLVNEATGKCLDVAKRSKDDRAPIQLWDCNQGENQRWKLTWQGPETFVLVSVNSAKCMDTGGGKLEQRTCRDADSQRWAF